MNFKTLITGLALIITPVAALSQTALMDFSSSMKSFSADFTQTVYDSDSVALQESIGRVELMRPGKFRWTYTEPSSQIIVADGLSLWVYEEDIQQVTVQPQAATLGNAPIGLLSGQKSIESEFTVANLGEEDGLQWFELKPKEQDADFNTIYIALDDNGLHAMELRDNFEQATQIKFSNFKKNVAFDAESFAFNPPEGADVVGEEGVAEFTTDGQAPLIDKIPDPMAADPEMPESEPAAETVSPTVSPAVVDDGLPPIAETEPLPDSTQIIDGSDLQIEEIKQ